MFGIAARTRRSRSHGSSWWKRTATAMCVLELKSIAWKPTRSIVGAIATMSVVVRPVALQRLWLPSRVVVSTIVDASCRCGFGRARGPSRLDRLADVEGERLRLELELLVLRLVDQPQDLADVVVAQRHQRRSPAPKVSITSEIAEPDAGGARRARAVTGRACRACSGAGAALDRPLDVLVRAEVALDALRRASTSAASCVVVEAGRLAPLGRHLDPHGAAAAGVDHVLDVLRADRPADDLAGHLADEVVVGFVSPPTTASPRPQLALTATMLGSPLTGLQVNMTPETSASTIFWTVTPIAASVDAEVRPVGDRALACRGSPSSRAPRRTASSIPRTQR